MKTKYELNKKWGPKVMENFWGTKSLTKILERLLIIETKNIFNY